MARPKKINVSETPVDITSTETIETANINTNVENQVVTITLPRSTFVYPVPETREDILALHKCLKDLGVNSIGDLEVKASKM